MNKGLIQQARAEAMGEAVQPEDRATFEDDAMREHVPLIHVGLPYLRDAHNGHAKAKAEEGEVWVTLAGFGAAELAMPKAQAEALRDQLNNAINAL